MAWSKNPLAYPKIFQDILDAAVAGKERFTLKTQPGKAHKYKFQFYGYRQAWIEKAKESRKIGDFAKAGEEEALAAKLARYVPMMDEAKSQVTFINKEVVLMEEDVQLEVSDKSVDDSALEAIDIYTRYVAERQQQITKHGKAQQAKPAEERNTLEGERVARSTAAAVNKWFGSEPPASMPVAPVPQTEEERLLLEQVRKELEESGDKHGQEET